MTASDLRNNILIAFDLMEQRRVELQKKLEQFPNEVMSVREEDGKWSVNQVLAHLSDSEFGTVRYINKKMQGMDSLRVTDFSARVRFTLLKWLLNSSIRYRMPRQLSEPSNDRSFEQLKQQFDKNRKSLRDLIELFPSEYLDHLIFKHPFAGRLSLYQTVLFIDDHYKHHMRQIDRILKVVENRGKSLKVNQ